MKNLLVSVVIPAYNVASKLSRCIQSVLSQTYKNLEVIIVNDCSTDNTLQIAEEWAKKDERIRVINHATNKKAGGARNSAIKVAKGDYLMLVDSDDTIKEEACEHLLAYAEEGNVDIVRCNLLSIYGNEQIPIRLTPSDNKDDLIRNAMFEGFFMAGCLVKRSLYIDNGIWYPEDCYYEDNPVHFYLPFVADKVAFVNETLYFYYHDNEASITASNSVRKMQDRVNTTNLCLQYVIRSGHYEVYKDLIDYSMLLLSKGTIENTLELSCWSSFKILCQVRNMTKDIINNKYIDRMSSRDRFVLSHPLIGWWYLKMAPYKRKVMKMIKKKK